MHVNSILNLEENDLAISSHCVISQWTSLTTEVTLERSRPHLVSRGSKNCHSTPVPTHISSSWPSMGKILNQRPLVECAKTSCRRLKHSVVSRPSRWIPTDCTPSTLWRLLSPNASSGFFGLPLDDRRVLTMVRATFCCRSCCYRPVAREVLELMGGPARFHVAQKIGKYQCCKGLRKSTYESFYDDLSSHNAHGHER